MSTRKKKESSSVGPYDFSETEGFYFLKSPDEPEPVLVHGYRCTDLGGQFVFGFNTYDGGSLVPLSELTEDTIIVPVEIVEKV